MYDVKIQKGFPSTTLPCQSTTLHKGDELEIFFLLGGASCLEKGGELAVGRVDLDSIQATCHVADKVAVPLLIGHELHDCAVCTEFLLEKLK